MFNSTRKKKLKLHVFQVWNTEFFSILKCISQHRSWSVPRNYQIDKIRLLYNQARSLTIVEATTLGEELEYCSFRHGVMEILTLHLLQDIFTLLVIKENKCQWAQRKTVVVFPLFMQKQQRFIVYFTLKDLCQSSALKFVIKAQKTNNFLLPSLFIFRTRAGVDVQFH